MTRRADRSWNSASSTSRGRCGAAAGLIGPETVSNAERGDISQVHPSGWVQHRYSFVDHEMLYNRSHLIAHQLCGEDATSVTSSPVRAR